MLYLNRDSPRRRISLVPATPAASFAKFVYEIPAHEAAAIHVVVSPTFDLSYSNVEVVVLKASTRAKAPLRERDEIVAMRARPVYEVFFKPGIGASKRAVLCGGITREHLFTAAALAVTSERFLSHAIMLYCICAIRVARWCIMIQDFDLRRTILSDGNVTLRPAIADDTEILARWFSDPDIYRYWGGSPLTHAEAALRTDTRTAGDLTVWPFIIEHSGEPAGYLQVWRSESAIAGIDLFLIPAFRAQGIGSRASRMVGRHLQHRHWKSVTTDPHSDDAVAIACFKKAGFVDRGARRDDGDHQHVILEFGRDESTPPNSAPLA